MIALEMAQRIFGMFPSSLIITNGAQTAVEPLVFFIDAKKDTVYLAGTTTIAVECLASRQWPRQGRLRDTLDENHWQ